MKIACIGWGSLIWDPRDLPVRGSWFDDGPRLPVEFARQSLDGRITLVILPGSALVRALWILLDLEDLDQARKRLARREKISERYLEEHVGYWSEARSLSTELTSVIEIWARTRELDAAVWTALPPRFVRDGKASSIPPTSQDVIHYLEHLSADKRERAEEYIRRTPSQIDTAYRRQIEAQLGWTP
jgi:hypothetical protein